MNTNSKKYLIALDMDGTLLNSNHEICLETKEYLKKLSSQGHKIIISSGRPIRGIFKYYQELELTTPAICYNGSYIYQGKENSFPEYCFSFPKEIILQIINDIGYDKLDNVILETNKDIYFLHEDESLDVFFTKKDMNVHLGKIEDNLNEDTMTMLIKIKDTANNNLIQKAIDKHKNINLRFWSGKWYHISEIYFDSINKGKALKKIADYYNIDRENIIAFGDATNDIELLSFAGIGIAMKNCEDELIKYADRISTYDNNNNGIKYELEKIIKEV